ncbi:MAG: hypothetical protein H7Z37_00995 [Pyrinomonadaceae bacterium]|nr:hypothetical protein [Pyrinomonadaceae bacterium]
MDLRFPTERLFPPKNRGRHLSATLHTIFVQDWLTKVIALFITFALWYGINSQRTTITKSLLGVRLTFRLPADTEISNDALNRVDITVTGDKSRVSALESSGLLVDIDLSDYKSGGDLIVQLKPETVNIELPPNVKLSEIEPNKIVVRLEPQIVKLLDVKPSFSGELPEGLEVYGASVIPAKVRVRGAASQINPLEQVSTEQINLDNLTENAAIKQVTINSLNPKTTVLDTIADVSLRIGERRIEKTFTEITVREPNGATVKPEKATVILYGARSIIENIKPNDLIIEITQNADNTTTPRLILPGDAEGKVEIRSLKPNNFTFTK